MGRLAADDAAVVAIKEADKTDAGVVGAGNELLFVHAAFLRPWISVARQM